MTLKEWGVHDNFVAPQPLEKRGKWRWIQNTDLFFVMFFFTKWDTRKKNGSRINRDRIGHWMARSRILLVVERVCNATGETLCDSDLVGRFVRFLKDQCERNRIAVQCLVSHLSYTCCDLERKKKKKRKSRNPGQIHVSTSCCCSLCFLS